jgi:mannose-6-phosphate isomerase
MPYPWGSRTAIAELLGAKPTGEPQAELWMGAHHAAPSTLDRGRGPESLADVVARAPADELGHSAVAALGLQLPFLLKVLAAAEPLSLQAHPSAAQAIHGFDAEERRGIPRDAKHRNYKDRSAKPELLCALTPFDALAGFRPHREMIAIFDALDVPELAPMLAPIHAPGGEGGAALAATFERLMTLPDALKGSVVAGVVEAAATNLERFPRERALVEKLAGLYPGDVGIVSALLLAPIHLEPGQAIFLGAGGLHAYLEGTGVEIMASSDNVLRGGLTPKHVDVPELLRVLDFGAGAPPVLAPRPIDAQESVYDTSAREFRLSVLRLDGAEITRSTDSGEILFAAATDGSLTVRGERREDGAPLALARGGALWVPASTRRYTLAGRGVVYRATTNLA